MCVQGIHILNVRRFPDPGKEFFLGNQGALLINQVFQDLHSLGAQVSNSLRCEHMLLLFIQADVMGQKFYLISLIIQKEK